MRDFPLFLANLKTSIVFIDISWYSYFIYESSRLTAYDSFYSKASCKSDRSKIPNIIRLRRKLLVIEI